MDARQGRTADANVADHCAADRRCRRGDLPHATFTRAVNYFGACGLSLPAGASPTGLPIGMQLIGRPFADATLLRLGRAFQSATDWHLF